MYYRTENINATFAKVRAEYGCVVQSTEVKHINTHICKYSILYKTDFLSDFSDT